jgi:hypothetical protein
MFLVLYLGTGILFLPAWIALRCEALETADPLGQAT